MHLVLSTGKRFVGQTACWTELGKKNSSVVPGCFSAQFPSPVSTAHQVRWHYNIAFGILCCRSSANLRWCYSLFVVVYVNNPKWPNNNSLYSQVNIFSIGFHSAVSSHNHIGCVHLFRAALRLFVNKLFYFYAFAECEAECSCERDWTNVKNTLMIMNMFNGILMMPFNIIILNINVLQNYCYLYNDWLKGYLFNMNSYTKYTIKWKKNYKKTKKTHSNIKWKIIKIIR